MTTLIHHARILGEQATLTDAWLLVDAGRIAAFGDGPAPSAKTHIDAHGHTLMAGFVDVHVHGGMGYDTMDASYDALNAMSRFYAAHGVTSFLATTWTDTRERTFAAMQAVQEALQRGLDGARLLGVHMEGPYFNPTFAGAQNPDYVRRANRDEMAALLELDVIRLLSIAPEYPENHWLIQEAVARGITVSVAHSGATYEQFQHAVTLGLSHSTHTFNAMTGLHHRNPGIVGGVMTTPSVRAELIADTIHVHPVAMDALWRTKGRDGLILITDAIRAAGLPDGEYPVDVRVFIVKDGACRLPDGTLAGSIATFEACVRHFMAATRTTLEEIWPVTSLNAARNLRMDSEIGSITIGKRADLVLVDDALKVQFTMVGGDVKA